MVQLLVDSIKKYDGSNSTHIFLITRWTYLDKMLGIKFLKNIVYNVSDVFTNDIIVDIFLMFCVILIHL